MHEEKDKKGEQKYFLKQKIYILLILQEHLYTQNEKTDIITFKIYTVRS